MAKVLGDNLGLHFICGFRKSFTMNRPCMYCEISYEDLKYMTNIDQNLIRTISKYNDYFQEEGKHYEYGIENYSILNRFPHFHVIENMVVDPMHDVNLGYIHFVLQKAINYFIRTYQNFDLDLLNSRIQTFDYGRKEQANKPGIILLSHVKNKLHLNANESITLLKCFPLIVFGLIPYPDSIYQLVLKTIEVVERIYAWEFKEQDLIDLDNIIIESTRGYINEFNTDMKPKNHHMLHYRAVIEANGPLRGLSTIRLEAKHQVIKNYTNNNKNRKFICYGVSKKMAFQFADFLFNLKKNKYLSRMSNLKKDKDSDQNKDVREYLEIRQLNPNEFISGNS